MVYNYRHYPCYLYRFIVRTWLEPELSLIHILLAIVAATAYREPNCPIRLVLVVTIRLKYLALMVIGTDLLFITSSNAGGHIAHLGGALAGLWFAAGLSKGKDITAWINKILDAIVSLFSFKPRKPKMKVHYGNSRQKDYDYNARKKSQSEEIDLSLIHI